MGKQKFNYKKYKENQNISKKTWKHMDSIVAYFSKKVVYCIQTFRCIPFEIIEEYTMSISYRLPEMMPILFNELQVSNIEDLNIAIHVDLVAKFFIEGK